MLNTFIEFLSSVNLISLHYKYLNSSYSGGWIGREINSPYFENKRQGGKEAKSWLEKKYLKIATILEIFFFTCF